MAKEYVVRLTGEQWAMLLDIIKRLKGTSQKVKRANILLKNDANRPAWTDAKIAEAFGCREQTIERLRKRFVTEGFETALERARRKTPPSFLHFSLSKRNTSPPAAIEKASGRDESTAQAVLAGPIGSACRQPLPARV